MSAFTQDLDARGLNCPLPILRTKKAMNGLASGDILKVVSTDKGSAQDIPAFCKQTGNELVESSQVDGEYVFFIKKL